MKKMVAVIVALVMICVFTSALAMGWEAQVTAQTNVNSFNLKVTKLRYTPNALYGTGYKEYTGTTLEKGDLLRFMVQFTIPKDVDESSLNNFKLEVTGQNVNLMDSMWMENEGTSWVTTNLDGSVLKIGTTYFVMYTAVATDSTNVCVTVKVGCGKRFQNGVFNFFANGTDFVAAHEGNEFIVNVANTNKAVKFTTINQKIKAVYVNAGAGYTELTYKMDGSVNLTNEEYEVLTQVFNVLGFTISPQMGYIHEEGFEVRFGQRVSENVTTCWNMSPTVHKENVPTVIPKTGDASVFALVIPTLMAAIGALSLKK